jgi:hypothetical protein
MLISSKKYFITAVFASLSMLVLSCQDDNDPRVLARLCFNVTENSPKGTLVGYVVEDNVLRKKATYQIVDGNAEGAFSMNESGAIFVENPELIDYEYKISYTLQVKAIHNNSDLEETVAIMINIDDVKELDDKIFEVEKRAPNGTIVGFLFETTKEQSEATYQIVAGNDDQIFAVNEESAIVVADNDNLNFKSKTKFTIVVKLIYTSTGREAFSVITINVKTFPVDLVAYYEFTKGSSEDLTPFHNDGVASNVVLTTDHLQLCDDALTFNYVSSYVKVASPSFLDNAKGTFAAWVKFTSLDHIQYIGSVADENSIESYISLLRFNNDTRRMGVYQRETGLANWVEGNTEIQANTYYFMALVADGKTWKIFINGKEETLHVVQGANTGTWIAHQQNITNFVIGNLLIQSPYVIPNFTGTIDQVMVWNRPLTSDEILYTYNNFKE